MLFQSVQGAPSPLKNSENPNLRSEHTSAHSALANLVLCKKNKQFLYQSALTADQHQWGCVWALEQQVKRPRGCGKLSKCVFNAK